MKTSQRLKRSVASLSSGRPKWLSSVARIAALWGFLAVIHCVYLATHFHFGVGTVADASPTTDTRLFSDDTEPGEPSNSSETCETEASEVFFNDIDALGEPLRRTLALLTLHDHSSHSRPDDVLSPPPRA